MHVSCLHTQVQLDVSFVWSVVSCAILVETKPRAFISLSHSRTDQYRYRLPVCQYNSTFSTESLSSIQYRVCTMSRNGQKVSNTETLLFWWLSVLFWPHPLSLCRGLPWCSTARLTSNCTQQLHSWTLNTAGNARVATSLVTWLSCDQRHWHDYARATTPTKSHDCHVISPPLSPFPCSLCQSLVAEHLDLSRSSAVKSRDV